MGEITATFESEPFSAFGIDVSPNSTELSLGNFLQNAQAVNENTVIDYPLLLNGNEALGTDISDRDGFYVVNHEGIIVYKLNGNQAEYIGDEAMQELEDTISAALIEAEAAVPVIPQWIKNKNDALLFEVSYIPVNKRIMIIVNGYQGQVQIKGYDISGKSVWEKQLFFLTDKTYELKIPRRVAVFKFEGENHIGSYYLMNK